MRRRRQSKSTQGKTTRVGGEAEDVTWFKQTINNACGFYGILHAICNGEARKMMGINTA